MSEMDWSRLTRNQRNALDILVSAEAPIEPKEPRGFRQALHDLWGMKLAERHFRARTVAYSATFLGRRVHAMLNEDPAP